MALSSIRLCGRMIFLILLLIQSSKFFELYTSRFIIKKKKIYADILVGIANGAIIMLPAVEGMLGIIKGSRKRRLSYFFRGWKYYIRIVLVPCIICAFGVRASLEGTVLRYPLVDYIKVPLCTTPILLILLLTTADDSFSSKSHKELVRNLSVLMVADLFDAIEMLNNAFESSLGAFDLSTIFFVIGAIITVIVSSLQMAEYEFIEGVEAESNEQIRHKPNVFRKIAELVINLVVLTIRLEVLIGHGKYRATVSTVNIFKNFIAIILSVMHICSLTPPAQALKDEG